MTKIDGDIVLDPHVAGSCVITLDETAATQLFDILGKCLGGLPTADQAGFLASLDTAGQSRDAPPP